MNEETKKRISDINNGIIPDGYKKTKVGIVPVEWEVVRFDEIATKFDYGLNVSAKKYDGENKYIRITDIDDESHKYSFDNVVSPDCEPDSDYLVKENDILFARTGASTGKSYLYNINDGKMYFAGFLIRANIKKDNNSYFIFSQMLTERYSNWVHIFSIRSGQPGINAQEYRSFEIILPPLPEQQKIAEILSAQDKLISLLEKKTEKLKELKKAYLQKMFPQKGSKYPELRFNGFTEPWEKREFDEVFISFANKNYQLQSTKYCESGKYPIIDQGKKTIIGYSDNEDKVCNKYPSIIFGDHTTEIKYVDFPFIIGADGVKTLSVKNGNTLFQYYNLQVNNVQQTGYKRHFSMLKEISLYVPTLEEQEKIGTYFRNLDNLIALNQRKLEKEKEKKKALMQLLLTGKVRVKL